MNSGMVAKGRHFATCNFYRPRSIIDILPPTALNNFAKPKKCCKLIKDSLEIIATSSSYNSPYKTCNPKLTI